MGRPTAAPRAIDLKIRLSQAESDMLEKCCAITGETKTSVVVKGISMLYESLQAKE